MAANVSDESAPRPVRSGSLERMPGLDGVRAIAVMAVLVFHANESWLPGGFLGVDVFFTLSGFLITSLLLSELQARGALRFGRFYRRRARRLLPAMFVVLIATSLLAMTLAQDAASRLREDIVASTFYVTNWWYVLHGTSYFEATGRPPLLQHLWSLAVEEQFYLAWPLLVYALWLLGRARAVRIGAVVGALGSTALMTWIATRHGMPGVTDSGRVYFGTDTHAMTLLVGAVLAAFWKQGGVISALTRRSRLLVSRIGVASLGCLIAVFWFVDPLSSGLYRGGFLLVALVTTGVVASAAVTGTAFSRGLSRQPLRWIGQRSYGIYLWHWPIFMVLRPGIDLDAQGWPVQVARFGLTFLAAELSYRFVEMPIRQGAAGRVWASWKESSRLGLATRVRLTVAITAGVVLALGVGLGSVREPSLQDALGAVTSVGADSLTASQSAAALSASAPDTSAPDTSPPDTSPPDTSPPDTSPPATSPPSTGPQLAPAPSPLPAPVPAHVSPSTAPSKTRPHAVPAALAGRDEATLTTTAVGDSVMLAVTKALGAQIPRMTVDASLSRMPEEIFDRIAERKNLGRLGEVVIIGAGTNGLIRKTDLISILNLLKDREHVILVTCHADRSWIEQSNASIRSAGKLFAKENVRVADWDTYAAHHRGVLYGDGIHPRPGDGATAYARLIRAALRQ